MLETQACRRCGVESTVDVGGIGLCPGCLLRFVAEGRGTASGVESDTDGLKPIARNETDPPSGGAGDQTAFGNLDDEEGTSFEERVYREHGLDVLGRLGQGGMGVVYEAEEPSLERRVALKVLKDEHRDDLAMRRRFLAEAKVGGRLQHPGLVPVYAIGEVDGLPFFTMRLIGGKTLAAFLREQPDLSWLVGVFLQVSQILAYAHDQRVVHRDVKPANIMVGDFGEVYLVDWGLAQAVDGHEAGIGGQAAVTGTPAYMSPEQAEGHPSAWNPRSDVFSLGATLCEILTGVPPYRGTSHEEVLHKARDADLCNALERVEACGAGAELKALVRDCLSPDPLWRPAHAGEVVGRVREYQAGVQRRFKEAEETRVRTGVRAVESAPATG